MNLRTLIEQLKDVRDALEDGDSTEVAVRIAFQPNWPLALDLVDLTLISNERGRNKGKPVLWLAVAETTTDKDPYAPRRAWEGGEVDLGEANEPCEECERSNGPHYTGPCGH